MKKRFNSTRFIILFVFLVMISGFITGVAFAANYLGSGHFETNQMYRCHLGTYTTQNQNASATWSSSTDLDIAYDCANENITTTGLDYGNTGWAGQAYICNIDGGCLNLNEPYASCIARSNVYYLRNWTTSQRQFNALHELAHCWSLDHRQSDSTSVTQQGQLSILQPNATDISLVNARH
ncbi:MAG: hypothetical protein Fur0022_27770 [Anaerolineales bacterium]